MNILCAVRDRAVNAFATPFTARTKQEAIRSFATEANRPDSQINAHPHDYELHQLGTFDQDTGAINAQLLLLAIAKDLITEQRHEANITGTGQQAQQR